MAIVAILALAGSAFADCWDPSLRLPTRAPASSATELTVEWVSLRSSECNDEPPTFDHYRVELSSGTAPAAAGEGELVARIFERDSTLIVIPDLASDSTATVAVFPCDSEGRCLSPSEAR